MLFFSAACLKLLYKLFLCPFTLSWMVLEPRTKHNVQIVIPKYWVDIKTFLYLFLLEEHFNFRNYQIQHLMLHPKNFKIVFSNKFLSKSKTTNSRFFCSDTWIRKNNAYKSTHGAISQTSSINENETWRFDSWLIIIWNVVFSHNNFKLFLEIAIWSCQSVQNKVWCNWGEKTAFLKTCNSR